MTPVELVLAFIGTGTGGSILTLIAQRFLIPKKEQKEFDTQLRDELWDRIKNLEGRLDEQNKMILEVMKENATLKFQLEMKA